MLNSLISPTDNFVKIIEQFDSVFSFFISTDLHKRDVKKHAKNAIKETVSETVFCSTEVFDFMLDLFVRGRIYFMLKYLNEKEMNDKKRKSTVGTGRKNRKASKVLHK